MKNCIVLIFSVLMTQPLFCQQKLEKTAGDPFCGMIENIYSLQTVSFKSEYKIKQVFDLDTSISHAEVFVRKEGTKILFLRIIRQENNKELLYWNDTTWIINPEEEKMVCLGTGFDQAMYNEMAVFFPQTLYSIDTLISYIEPYWKVIKETNNRAVVSFTINDAPKEISDIRAEFTVGSLDFLPYKTYQESVYMKADKIIQEQTFSDYSFPDPMQLVAPGYFTTYEKDLQYLAMTAYSEENEEDTIVLCQFLPDIQLYDISGNPFNLPDSGLILLDFWYVGCAPCMKSAVIIEKLYSEYKKDIGFFSVNETDRDTAKIHLFTSKMGISFPVLRCSNEKIAPRVTGNNAYPVFILLDGRTRKILWKLTGYTENLYELIINSIEQYR